MDDLVEECSRAIFEVDGSDSGVRKRQIFEDIKFMESDAGYSIELERLREGRNVYYRYTDHNFSINSQPLNSTEAEQLKEVLLTLSRFKGLPQFSWVEEMITRLESNFSLNFEKSGAIQFEQNEFLMGLEHLSKLYEAIVNSRTINLKYKSFKQEKEEEFVVHPQFLKQYNNRWFLFGVNEGRNNLTNYALDRIVSIEESTVQYKDAQIDIEEYFEDVVGVTVPNASIPVGIKIRLSDELVPYIKSKPIHGSQKLNGNILELQLIPNYEFESKILSLGEGIEIIEPLDLKEKIKERIKKMLAKI